MNWFTGLRRRTIALSILITLAACGSSSSPSKAILGAWRQLDTQDIYNFGNDGQLNINHGGRVIQGSYRFLEDNRLRLEFPQGELLNRTGDIQMSENHFSFKAPTGSEDFERVQIGGAVTSSNSNSVSNSTQQGDSAGGQQTKKLIAGKWQGEVSQNNFLEFFKDGKVIVSFADDPKSTVEGTYTLLENGQLTFDIPGTSGAGTFFSQAFTANVEGDELVLRTTINGSEATFKFRRVG